MSDLKEKAERTVKTYFDEHGMDDLSPTGLSERFLNTYQSEYQQAGEPFLKTYLDHKFVEGY